MRQNTVYNQVVPKFKKVLRGYSPAEVDAFIQEMVYYYDILIEEKQKLLAEIKAYRRQKKYLSDLLIRSKQQVENILAEARQKARNLLIEAEQQRQKMELDLIKSLQQKNTHLVGKYFLLAQKHLDELEREFTGEMKNTFKQCSVEQNLPQGAIFENTIRTNSIFGREKQATVVTEVEAILAGRTLERDIVDQNNNVILPKGTVVTPRIIEIIICKGLYGELIEALDSGQVNQRKEGQTVAG